MNIFNDLIRALRMTAESGKRVAEITINKCITEKGSLPQYERSLLRFGGPADRAPDCRSDLRTIVNLINWEICRG